VGSCIAKQGKLELVASERRQVYRMHPHLLSTLREKTVTIHYFMTLYIVSPDDGSVKAEACCVAVP
jgi:hypothetical protein